MFTKAVGSCFIILAVLRLTPFINATGKWLLYVSIAAFFFMLSDVIEFILEGISVKKNVKIDKILIILRSVFMGCAVIAIIVFPTLKMSISVKEVNAWSDALTLASLGIAIVLIGLKVERVLPLQKRNTSTQDDGVPHNYTQG
ncbi:hypothetical protein [Paenibacillus sp. JDR-2]|uniref:hypothetical protein n=1 Tax=Paenibacillus sp. (strain JDR-2) TaxID=324057 RepID=UPI000166652D|nr:hypothetical protein [Paenibacillus sp. JDR-2]ACS99845.1 hypothetical protein Pjdr2_1168 [Paenibacillus sp. JDR-2]